MLFCIRNLENVTKGIQWTGSIENTNIWMESIDNIQAESKKELKGWNRFVVQIFSLKHNFALLSVSFESLDQKRTRILNVIKKNKKIWLKNRPSKRVAQLKCSIIIITYYYILICNSIIQIILNTIHYHNNANYSVMKPNIFFTFHKNGRYLIEAVMNKRQPKNSIHIYPFILTKITWQLT